MKAESVSYLECDLFNFKQEFCNQCVELERSDMLTNQTNELIIKDINQFENK